LIGYEDRLLARQDFNDDRKDAGEMGAGHTVTVLYEIVPPGEIAHVDAETRERPAVDPLKYQTPGPAVPEPPRPAPKGRFGDELLTVKVRYKQPDGDVSQLIEQAVKPGGRAPDLAFAAAAAEFGMLLRDGQSPLDRWQDLTQRIKLLSVSSDAAGDRQALADLVDLAAGLRKLRR
jgi:Ca-activated chloride channel family protein